MAGVVRSVLKSSHVELNISPETGGLCAEPEQHFFAPDLYAIKQIHQLKYQNVLIPDILTVARLSSSTGQKILSRKRATPHDRGMYVSAWFYPQNGPGFAV